MKIHWLDNKSAAGQYILEIHYADGGVGFLKNHSLEVLSGYYNTLKNFPEYKSFTIHSPESEFCSKLAA